MRAAVGLSGYARLLGSDYSTCGTRQNRRDGRAIISALAPWAGALVTVRQLRPAAATPNNRSACPSYRAGDLHAAAVTRMPSTYDVGVKANARVNLLESNRYSDSL